MAAHGFTMLRPASFGPSRGPYSPGVLVAAPTRVLYTAGQTPTDADGNIVGVDFETQARRVFENLGVVLEEAGMSFSNVVKFTNYLINPEDMSALRVVRTELWAEYFPDGALPADTLLFVSRLARPDFLVEIEAVAMECVPH